MRIMNNKNLMIIYVGLLMITFGIVTIELINIFNNQKDLASVVLFFWVPIYILQFIFYSISVYFVIRMLLSIKESGFENDSCLMSKSKLLLLPQIVYFFIYCVVIIIFLIMRNTIVLKILLGYPYLYMSLFLFICSIYFFSNFHRRL